MKMRDCPAECMTVATYATASSWRVYGACTVVTTSMGSAAFGSPSNRGHGFTDADKIPSLNTIRPH